MQLSFDPGTEIYIPFAKRKLVLWKQQMGAAGVGTFHKRVDVSDGSTIYVDSTALGQGRYNDRIRITGGAVLVFIFAYVRPRTATGETLKELSDEVIVNLKTEGPLLIDEFLGVWGVSGGAPSAGSMSIFLLAPPNLGIYASYPVGVTQTEVIGKSQFEFTSSSTPPTFVQWADANSAAATSSIINGVPPEYSPSNAYNILVAYRNVSDLSIPPSPGIHSGAVIGPDVSIPPATDQPFQKAVLAAFV